ncbi:uncharacterized protein LOC143073117 [Mytilus galloprovincialis]|uniref:uncharacterized protein LOC143073117 n=1 Tax=Mytilus galloprovincialis TaxID=29158 RepID=UPI003F7C2240
MCDNCKIKRHPRIKNSMDHKVIDIKDVGLHDEELDFTNIKCKDHPEQNCCLFCQSCNSLVCPTCVSKVHKKHDLIEISEAYDIKKDKLRKGQKKIKIEQSEVLNKKGLLERLKNGENAKYTRVIENIKNQEDTLKQALHKHIEKIRNEVDQDQKTVLQSIDADLDTISRSMHQSNETNTEIEDLINSTNSAKFFFHEVSRMENSMDVPAPKIKSTYKSIPDFVPGEINQFNVGVLQSKNTPLKLSVSLNIHKQYETELHHVSDIIPCYDNSIWLNSSLYGKLIKVKANRRNLKTISSLSIKVYGMTLTTDNDILLSIGNHNIQHLSNTTGKINTAYNMSPFHSNIIHSTRNNKVIVGVVDSNVQYKVIVINKKGEHETVYEHDQHNQRLFKYPNSITSTDNGNIHVADYAPDSDRGRVVVLGQDGSTINIYTGHPYI